MFFMNLNVPKIKGIDFLRNKGKCPREQPLSKFYKIPDSVALYTKKYVQCQLCFEGNKAHQQASNQITEILQ
jgi:hypothetical protein